MTDGIICEFGKRTNAFKNGDTFTVSSIDYYRHVYGYTFYLSVAGYIQYSGNKDGLHKKYLHRVIKDVNDPNIYIDHINHNPLNNRRENLRLCTNQENQFNRRISKKSTTGFKGVSLRKCGKYQAQIMIDGETTYLGYHQTAEEAHLAYQEASIKHYGKFAFDGIEPPPKKLNLIHESTLDSAETRLKVLFHRNVNTNFDQIPIANPDHEKFIRDWFQKSATLHTGESVL